MKPAHQRVLVLNADYTPIGLVDWTKAITLQFKDIVRTIDFYKDDYIKCSGGTKWPIPAVVSLKEYIKPQKTDIPFSRKNVFLRDNLTCQYCGIKYSPNDLTYDHVIPRSKWTNRKTPTCWENIVTCCYPCNNKKADYTPSEIGMKPIKTPRKPDSKDFILGLAPWTKIQDEWVPFLPKRYLKLLSELPEPLP